MVNLDYRRFSRDCRELRFKNTIIPAALPAVRRREALLDPAVERRPGARVGPAHHDLRRRRDVILLHPPPPLVGVSTVMERERQQNDSLVNG